MLNLNKSQLVSRHKRSRSAASDPVVLENRRSLSHHRKPLQESMWINRPVICCSVSQFTLTTVMMIATRDQTEFVYCKEKRREEDVIGSSVWALAAVTALAVIFGSVSGAKCCGELQTDVAAELRSSSTVITLSASGRRKSPGQGRHITPLQRQPAGRFNTAKSQTPPWNNNTQDYWMVQNPIHL